jgi:hypothetical protein
MAKVGYLKRALGKKTKEEKPFISLLIVDAPTTNEGQWMSLFDAHWFGGTEKKPSPYDIRRYASLDTPTKVVYETIEKGGFVNCEMIRPFDETWAKDTITIPLALEEEKSAESGAQMIASAIEMLVDGIGLVIAERLKEDKP